MRFFKQAYASMDLKDVTVTLQNGGAEEVILNFGDGTFTWDEAQERVYEPNRGRIGTANGGSVRNGDDTPMSVAFDAKLEAYDSVGLTSADPDGCNPYAVDILFENVPPGVGCGQAETLIFRDFRWETGRFDPKTGMVNWAGKCNVTEPEVV